MLIGLFTHGLAIKKLLATLSLSTPCNHCTRDKVIITACRERLKSSLNSVLLKLVDVLEGGNGQIIAPPMRYSCNRLSIITLEESIRGILEFMSFSVIAVYVWRAQTFLTLFSMSTRDHRSQLFLEMRDSNPCLFCRAQQKPAGCTVQYSLFIISCVGGSEMREEKKRYYRKKRNLQNIRPLVGLQVHALPPFLISSDPLCFIILRTFSTSKHLSWLPGETGLKHKTNTALSWQSGYSSN